MIATTTQLNTPGPDLAALPGVHALTDVTGFGLAGHALELARGAKCQVQIDWASVPLLGGVRELAAQGNVTGASGRNWAGYGKDVALPEGFAAPDKALLTDPQTSGGLLWLRRASGAGVFRRHGFGAVAESARWWPGRREGPVGALIRASRCPPPGLISFFVRHIKETT
jgi:selenide,water dikinase